jgi:hypothetical protein
MAGVETTVNFPWAICIAREDWPSLADLRFAAGVEVAEEGSLLWLRGQRGDERLAAKLSALPARERYEWLATQQLRQLDRRIPTARFPDLPWQPLSAWLRVEIPTSALPANPPRPIAPQLVRSTQEREAELLLTSVDELKRFAGAAAQVRLQRLQFAVSANGAVFVRGQPLPPLPGRRFVVHGGVAVPAGFSWEPAVGADVLTRRFGVSGDALVVWNEDGTVTRLHSEQFVALSRSAVRATEQTLIESQ